MTDRQKEAIEILNKIKDSMGESLTEKEYIIILEAIWDSEMKPIQIQPIPFNIPAYQLPCYHPDGICINPQRDCVNCPKQGNNGYTWTTNTNSTIKKD